jgi:hypothetical protein
MVKGLFTELITEDTCVKIYDPANKKLLGVFPNFTRAGKILNVTPRFLLNKTETKKRVYSEYYKKEIAVRYGTMKEGDKELIDKTLKNKKL